MDKVDSITVRMYNTGSVGDCLFLQFKKNGVTSFRMLIDCGGFNTSSATITKCVDNISALLEDKPLDLVVVTHEHLDHVSGFNQAKEVFNNIVFNQVWMAWTENPGDKLAKKLKKDLGKKLKALITMVESNRKKLKTKISKTRSNTRLKKRLEYYSSNWDDILEALQFENGTMKNSQLRLKTSDAMKYVKAKSKSKDKDKMFLKPGEVLKMKGAEGIKFHILGPPYDQDLSGIKNEMQEDEMYSLSRHASLIPYQAFMNVANKLAGPDGVSLSPFSNKYILSKSEYKKFTSFYESTNMKWRQIEEDWLETSEELAIALRDYMNNTSLAMALEFESNGKVLLFPADAQSGNWISWHDNTVSKSLKKNGGKTANELLNNTIFYKVGHHGSHNGTASKSGLDKMKKLEVAMIPLVQDKVPDNWGGSKNFPAKALYKELIRRTNGAIIRTDEGLINDSRAIELRKKNLSAKKIKRLKESNKGLYQEWTVE